MTYETLERLRKLLNDWHPGLVTWCQAVARHCDEISGAAAIEEERDRLREALRTLLVEANHMCDDADLMPDDMARAITQAHVLLATTTGGKP